MAPAALMLLPLLALVRSTPTLADSAPVPIKEWNVPWGAESRPRDPAVAPDGKIWFVGQAGNYVGRLDPLTGEFKRFAVDPGTNPHNIIIDAAGRPWFSGNRNAMIGRIDPATGALTRYPMPDKAAGDPHTMVFDQKGDIWFTVQGGNFVGRLAAASGKIDLIKMTTPGARPYGIVLDPSGRPYFDLFGTNKIATVDPKTLALREYALPDPKSRPRRIARTSDGFIWYGDYTRGYLGRLDPQTGAVREWKNPAAGTSLPYAMTSDDADRLWMVETGVQPNRLIGFDPKTGQFFSVTPIPSGGGTVRHMVFDRKSRMIWFGTDNGTIGRAVVPPAAKITA